MFFTVCLKGTTEKPGSEKEPVQRMKIGNIHLIIIEKKHLRNFTAEST